MTDLPKSFAPGRFEFIIEWRGNRGGFRLQRFELSANNFVDAVKKSLSLTQLLERAGAYPKNSVRLVGVAYYDALAQYESEHRVGRLKNKADMVEQVRKILATKPAQEHKARNPVNKIVVGDQPKMTTLRTRSG